MLFRNDQIPLTFICIARTRRKNAVQVRIHSKLEMLSKPQERQ